MNLWENILRKGSKILLVVFIIASVLLLIQTFICLFSTELDEYLALQVIATYYLWAMHFYVRYSEKKKKSR